MVPPELGLRMRRTTYYLLLTTYYLPELGLRMRGDLVLRLGLVPELGLLRLQIARSALELEPLARRQLRIPG